MSISERRTYNYLRQVKGAVVCKGLAVAASLVTIPVMVKYLGHEQFGIWTTLLSLLSWSVFFDLGIGNGLKNKVGQALATGDTESAANYVRTAYSLIGLLAFGIWAILFTGAFFVSWQRVFNTTAVPETVLRTSVQLTGLFFLGNFCIGLVGSLLSAVQKTSAVAAGQMLCNFFVLGVVILLQEVAPPSINAIALGYGSSLIISNLLLTFWFSRVHPELRPRIGFHWPHARPLLSMGFQFFVIQLAALVLFTTDKLVITQLFGPKYVTPYEVIFKLFGLVTFLHALVSTPLWPAYTDAHSRGDRDWIRGMLSVQKRVFLGLVAATVLLVFGAQSAVDLWIGPMSIPESLVAVMAFYVLVAAWNNIYAMVVNGIGAVRAQLYAAIVAMIVNIPLSIFLAKYVGLGVSGVVLGTACSLLIAATVLPLQVRSLLRAV